MAKGNGTKEGHMRILVAEDERDMSRLITRTLEKEG